MSDLASPAPITRRLVVGDLHGDWQSLVALLRRAGAIDADGSRRDGWWLAQLGDLIHGGHHAAGDSRCLEEGLRLFDALLLGNHELPHAFPSADLPSFFGETPLAPACQARLAAAIRDGRYAAAASVDGWLLTHAGLHPSLARAEGLPDAADACARELNLRFARRLAAGRPEPLFDAVGPQRGGADPVGGIFWLDWDELRAAAEANHLPQIVGHTPRPNGPEPHGPRLWCVDVGAALSGKVCALLKDGPEGAWMPVVA